MARRGSSGEACGLVRAGTTTASGDTSRRQVPRRSMIATHTILQSRYRIDDLIDRGDAFLILELLGGATVRQLVDGGALPSDQVARIGGETTAALDYIHRQGIVHRDVKPSNLMLDDYGSVRLADFGIARLLGGTRITGTHQAIGTMAYIAPEQLEGGEVGPPTDVYSLGLVLIECLSGRRAFHGRPAGAPASRLSREPDIPAGLPGCWPGMLSAMTARDPHARPSAAAVRDHLAGRAADPAGLATAPLAAAAVAAAGGGGTATIPGPPPHTQGRPAPPAPPRPRRRGPRG